jgi:hypothetical protein
MVVDWKRSVTVICRDLVDEHREVTFMGLTMFYVTNQPSKDRLIDALKYGDDPNVRFRVALTIRHHSISYNYNLLIQDVEVIGFERANTVERGWAVVTVKIHQDLEYYGHIYRAGIYKCTLDLSRRKEGTIGLDLI